MTVPTQNSRHEAICLTSALAQAAFLRSFSALSKSGMSLPHAPGPELVCYMHILQALQKCADVEVGTSSSGIVKALEQELRILRRIEARLAEGRIACRILLRPAALTKMARRSLAFFGLLALVPVAAATWTPCSGPYRGTSPSMLVIFLVLAGLLLFTYPVTAASTRPTTVQGLLSDSPDLASLELVDFLHLARASHRLVQTRPSIPQSSRTITTYNSREVCPTAFLERLSRQKVSAQTIEDAWPAFVRAFSGKRFEGDAEMVDRMAAQGMDLRLDNNLERQGMI
jgi:hypothetical protein